MMLLIKAEWMRFIRNRVNLFMLLIATILATGSAVWSGIAAAEYRQNTLQETAQWRAKSAAKKNALATSVSAGESPKAAREAFDFARSDAPHLHRPAFGGLALSLRQFILLPATIKISIEGRHLDGRRSEPLENPLLESSGLADFAVVVALLLPLTMIGLSYGMVQEARQQGIWRIVCTQCLAPWHVLFCGLSVRYLASMAPFAGASLLAFWLDPGSSFSALAWWLSALAAFGLVWIAVAGLLNMVTSSAPASALGMLGIWLFTTFAAPSILWWYAEQQVPAQQRLETIIRIRTIQHDVEMRAQSLLEDWYRNNKQYRPETVDKHTWPVSFIPRYMEQDRLIAPLMNRFEEVRVKRMETIDSFGWLAPGLSLVLAADRLAGADAMHHDRFMKEVDRSEQAWRDYFVPKIMNYRGMQAKDADALPVFSMINLQNSSAVIAHLRNLVAMGFMLIAISAMLRKRLRKP